jgi:lipopolysaccharide export system protein LptA
VLALVLIAIVAGGLAIEAAAQLPVQEPGPAPTEPITIAADSIRNWTQGDRRVLLMHGNVYVAQGLKRIRAPHAVVWINEASSPKDGLKRIEVYAEGGVRIDGPRRRTQSADLFDTLQTRAEVRVEMKERFNTPAADDLVYRHAEARRASLLLPSRPGIQLTSFQAEPPEKSSDGRPLRRLRWGTRTMKPFDLETVRVSEAEQAIVITGGINLIIYNVEGLGTVDILTDRMVVWRTTTDTSDLAQGESVQSANEPLELYLEGNVIIRRGGEKIEAKQAYYDVNRNLMNATDAELMSVHPELGSPLYFRARKLRQVSADKYVAERTQATGSQFPSPGIDVQTEVATIEAISSTEIDPETGEPVQAARHLVTATNNFFYIEGIPVFYVPYVQKELDEMSIPLRKFAIRQSSNYGTELRTTWDAYALFGLEQPEWVTKWELDLDFLGDRGPAAGSLFEYRGEDLFGFEGKSWGLVETWGIHDTGLDNIGNGREDIEPEQTDRGRFLFRHHQELPSDFSLNLELAYISDINFLEQFFEKEWEEDKDQETALYLKQQRDNWAWSIFARDRLMSFLTTTEYTPQLDFYWLGEPLLFDWLTYYTHSSLGYLRFLDSERSNGDIYPGGLGDDGATFSGGRFDSLHELNLPFSAGPFRVVPYVMGRASWWGEGVTEDSESRGYGAAGARASMPLWRVFPCVESDLWNVHGLAHKIVFSADYSYAQSSLDHTLLPQYDELDEDAEQIFRERFLFRDYVVPGIPFPPGLDSRMYAIRRGLMTAPESVDDLHVLRMDIRQRLQTKRGLPGQRHVIDWMTLDTAVAFFPNEDRDNFGENFGLYTYDYSWHIGDRTSFLSSGWFETYDDAPRMWSAGIFMERPPRGSFYVGYSELDPIESRVAQLAYNYWMSPKWISSFSTSHDFGETENLGQSIILTRIGSDIVFRFGVSWNPLRDNFGVGIELQPRIYPALHLGSLGGPKVPLEYAPVE